MLRTLTEIDRCLRHYHARGLGPTASLAEVQNWESLNPSTIRLTWVSAHPEGSPTIPAGQPAHCLHCNAQVWSIHVALNPLSEIERAHWMCNGCGDSHIVNIPTPYLD